MILFTAVNTSGKKKQGHCVQGDYKHFGNQTHSPSGVFCLGVYYTRDNTDKDRYIRQGRSQYGAFRTSTSVPAYYFEHDAEMFLKAIIKLNPLFSVAWI